MTLNIHEDTRDRGLEVLLYCPEKKVVKEEPKKSFKFKVRVPIPFTRELYFHFETFITDNSTLSEKN
jgi:hypothetical protein